MLEHQQLFQKRAAAFDSNSRKMISKNLKKHHAQVFESQGRFSDFDLAKHRVEHLKHKAINSLEKYIKKFELNFQQNGGRVTYATDAECATNQIIDILNERGIKQVTKSRSTTLEEIDINKSLEKNNIAFLETEFGAHILAEANEKSHHMVMPIIHKSSDDIAKILIPSDSDEKLSAETVVETFRKKVRPTTLESRASITGANFIIADIGGIAITENEGNGLLNMAFPELHIVVVGIDKVIPSVMNLDTFWPVLATEASGQPLATYNTIISGPIRDGESDGPKEMIVVIIDNNRSKILERKTQRQSLNCIRCGACLNSCPVYRAIGGEAYGSTYNGPIGAVITPLMKEFEKFQYLNYACTLCGKCTESCPANIPLHQLILKNRQIAFEAGQDSPFWKKNLKRARLAAKHRWILNVSYRFKGSYSSYILKKSWGNQRSFPQFAKSTFNKKWMSNERPV